MSRPGRHLLTHLIRKSRLPYRTIADLTGITETTLRRYRDGTRGLPVDYLRETLPDALRAWARQLRDLATELETTPIQED